MPGDPVPADDPFALPEDKLPVDSDWLAIPEIQTQKFAARYDALRFQVMKGTERLWACDGEYVACRPSGFHAETRARHQRFLAAGHYEHVGTFDDVQVFKLLPGSPFRREVVDIREAGWYECLRGAVLAACARDWVLYVDVLEEIATRLKSTPTGTETDAVDPVIAKERWEFVLQQIFNMIEMRRGPTPAECSAGKDHVMRRRGLGNGRRIALPPTRRIQ